MSTELQSPSRQGLILSLALVALYGRQQEAVLQARWAGYANWDDLPIHAECRRISKALKEGQVVDTVFEELIDRMAHTRQTARISQEEWDSVVRLTQRPSQA